MLWISETDAVIRVLKQRRRTILPKRTSRDPGPSREPRSAPIGLRTEIWVIQRRLKENEKQTTLEISKARVELVEVR